MTSFTPLPVQTTRTVTGRPVETVPEWWLARGGSRPEYWVSRAIIRTGRLEGAGAFGFTYQHKFFGGRMQKGGVIVDFIINSPYLGINVQSLYFHNRTIDQRGNDVLLRASLEAGGLRVEFISEEEAINQPDNAVREAISGTRGKGPLGT